MSKRWIRRKRTEDAETQQLLDSCANEKNASVVKRLLLVTFVKIHEKSRSEAADMLGMSRGWGIKWYKRYCEGRIDGLRDKPRSGRPPKVYPGIMKRLRKMARDTVAWTAKEMRAFILENTGVEYDLSHVRKIVKKWGYTRKVPVLKHVRRASKKVIRKFQKSLEKLVPKLAAEGYTICVQDESIAVAEARPRKGVYTLRHKRATYTYTGNHGKTIVYGLITANGEGYFERNDKFTKVEFDDFLKNACEKFGKIAMILDKAPQHRANQILETVKKLDGKVVLIYLPPGCPDLNAIEELWRQMKMAVLAGPYIKFKSMCTDIDEWLKNNLPALDIFKYLYRSIS